MDKSVPILQLQAVTREFDDGDTTHRVLHGIDLQVNAGEFLALVGPSGSGKSTLLNLMGLLDRPSSGALRICGQRADGMSDRLRTDLRARTLGFVFQHHLLVSAFSALDNVAMPLRLHSDLSITEIHDRALQALHRVGLENRANVSPVKLSGGQQQRVAIARALVHQPALVLADEPTGNLDSAMAQDIFALMRSMNRETGAAFILVTHDSRLAERCDRVVEMLDGRIVADRAGMAAS